MSSSGLMVLEKKILNDPTPILYFCDYLPFEDDLVFNLKSLESHLPKDDLYQV
jgi:hypothetical protein